ncbi:MAG: hypothetical protein PHQ86_08710, partial [Dehalococcoidales bacterium]|nr:hypothetical protein [Dehalococcoidales bacterium]
MNAHYLIPLIAAVIYISLLIVTIFSRPWQKQHKRFVMYLVAATIWSLSDFFLYTNFFADYKLAIFRVVTSTSIWWAINLYYFSRSFLGLPGSYGVWIGYGLLAIFCSLCALGLIPPGITFNNGVVNPTYGWWLILFIIPFAMVTSLGVHSLGKRLKTVTNPQERNKIGYLISAIALLAIFGFIGITPISREVPLTHIGSLLAASILAYAIIEHDLISINSFLRHSLGWASLVIIGIGIYMLFLFILYSISGFKLNINTLILTTLSAVVSAIIIYRILPIFWKTINQLFYRGTYSYRQALLSFNSKMSNIIKLDELADEMLTTIVKALLTEKASLLFEDTRNGNFTTQFTYPETPEKLNNPLEFNLDNPVVTLLEKRTTPLDLKQINIIPQLSGLWQTEKENLITSNFELLCPIKSRIKLIGILALGRKQSRTLYSQGDIDLVMSLANLAGII